MFERPPREREFLSWAYVTLWSGLIFATVPFVRAGSDYVRSRWGGEAFTYGVTAIVILVAGTGVALLLRRRRSSAAGYAWLLGIAGLVVYLAFGLKAGSPEEAVHYLEYGVLSLLLTDRTICGPSELRRAAPALPRNGLTVTRTRAGQDDVDLFVIVAGIRDSARILCIFTKKFLFLSKLRLRTTSMLCFNVVEAQYAVRSYSSWQNARSGPLAEARIAMTAVVEIAKERRVGLAAEFARLDDFIRMAEALANDSQGSGRDPVMDAAGAKPGVLPADRGDDADLVGEDMAARDGVAGTAMPIEEPAIVEDGVPDVSLESDPAHNEEREQAIDKLQVDSDQFAFRDEASVSEDELVLINPLQSDAFPLDVHVGRRIYQRRWMMGMTQQQLGDLIGVKIEQIQKYETGAKPVSSRRMWDVAAAMEVPMSYFFEGIEGQAPDTGEARGEILSDKEALELVRGAPLARTVQAS